MPQVPTYDGPQLAAAPLRTPSARALDVSSGTRAIGQGLANLGEGIDRYQERKAQTEAYDVEARVTSDWLKWDSEARAQGRGENVDRYQQEATDWWNKAAETYGQNLSPRARALIGRSLQQKRVQAEASVLGFTSAERERHADEVANADIATTIQFGVTNGDIATTKEQVREKVAAVGARKGWTTEQVQARVAGYVSDMHMAQIDNLSAEEGLAYFNANIDEIDAGKQGAVRKSLERSVEIEAKQREAEAEKAKREAEDRLVDAGYGMFEQGVPLPASYRKSMIDAGLGRELVQLDALYESRAAREAKGTKVETDIGTYLDVRSAIERGEPVDLRRFENAISQTDLKSLADMQGKASQQDTLLTDAQRQDKALTDLGIDKKKAPDAAYQVLGLIDDRIREASRAKGGKDLMPDEKQAIIDGVVQDRVYLNEWGTDTQKLAPLLTPDEVEDAYVIVNDKRVPLSVVPADKRMEIIRGRRARGLPVTEEAIVRAFLQKYPNGMPKQGGDG
jgi:hypothetical protein